MNQLPKTEKQKIMAVLYQKMRQCETPELADAYSEVISVLEEIIPGDLIRPVQLN